MNIEEMAQRKEQLEARIEGMLEEFSRKTGIVFDSVEVECLHSPPRNKTRRNEVSGYRYHAKTKIIF